MQSVEPVTQLLEQTCAGLQQAADHQHQAGNATVTHMEKSLTINYAMATP